VSLLSIFSNTGPHVSSVSESPKIPTLTPSFGKGKSKTPFTPGLGPLKYLDLSELFAKARRTA